MRSRSEARLYCEVKNFTGRHSTDCAAMLARLSSIQTFATFKRVIIYLLKEGSVSCCDNLFSYR